MIAARQIPSFAITEVAAASRAFMMCMNRYGFISRPTVHRPGRDYPASDSAYD